MKLLGLFADKAKLEGLAEDISHSNVEDWGEMAYGRMIKALNEAGSEVCNKPCYYTEDHKRHCDEVRKLQPRYTL